MLAVYKKELRSSLYGMTGPIFIVAVLAIIGFFTQRYQFANGATQFEYSLADGAFWSLILTPVLTMRSFSEERRSKTDQLLYSLPITTPQIVLGKYFAMVTVFAIPCAIFCLYPVIISFFATSGINYALSYGAIFAYFLLGCAVIAIGMLISSLLESQVICAIVNLALLLALYFITSLAGSVPDSAQFALGMLIVLSLIVGAVVYFATKNYIAAGVSGLVLVGIAVVVYFVDSSLYTGLSETIVRALLLFVPVAAFANSVFDITCFVYYLSVAALFVFCTVQSVENRRWN